MVASASADQLSERDMKNAGGGGAVHDLPAIWERIRGRVERQLAVVELHAHRLLDTGLSTAEADAASASANALLDWFEPLEMPAPAGLAREIAGILQNPEPGQSDGIRLASLTEDIRVLVASAIAEHETFDDDASPVLVIGAPSARLDTLCWVLARRGHPVTQDALTLPPGRDGEREPEALVVELTDDDSLANLLEAIKVQHPRAAVVGVHAGAPLRVLGDCAEWCDTIIGLETQPATIVLELSRAVAARTIPQHVVAVGTPDPVADRITEVSGLKVELVLHYQRALEQLNDPAAGLFIGPDLDADDAIKVAQLVRAIPMLRSTPVAWMGEKPTGTELIAARLGVDCVADDESYAWSLKLRQQLREAIAANHVAADRIRTTLLPWAAAQLLIDRALVSAHRTGAAVSVATIRLDDELDQAAVDQVHDTLRTEFRRNDILGLRRSRELVVALQGAPRATATRRLGELVTRLPVSEGECRIGVAQFPADGRSSVELVSASKAAMERAAAKDGPAVAATDWRPHDADSADVLIVDPDEMLCEVLQVAFEARGHSATTTDSGLDALDHLVGDTANSLPRLLVLDLDAPGLDAFALLNHLRTANVLGRFEVLLLSARSRESDQRRAIALGVDEIVRKPFSITLFLHRAERLLQRNAS